MLYSSGLHEHEKELAARLYEKDADLKAVQTMLEIRLRRALDAQAKWEEQAGILDSTGSGADLPVADHESESVTIANTDGVVHTTKREKAFRRRRDFGEEIRALSRLIAEMSLRQAELRQLTITEDLRSQLASEIRKDALAADSDLEASDD